MARFIKAEITCINSEDSSRGLVNALGPAGNLVKHRNYSIWRVIAFYRR